MDDFYCPVCCAHFSSRGGMQRHFTQTSCGCHVATRRVPNTLPNPIIVKNVVVAPTQKDSLQKNDFALEPVVFTTSPLPSVCSCEYGFTSDDEEDEEEYLPNNDSATGPEDDASFNYLDTLSQSVHVPKIITNLDNSSMDTTTHNIDTILIHKEISYLILRLI